MKFLRYSITILALLLGTLGFAQHRALVIIDMQPSFQNRGGHEKELPNILKAQKVFARQVQLIRMAKKFQRTIVVVEYKGFGDTNGRLLKELEGYTNTQTFQKESDGMFSSGSGIAETLKEYLTSKQISELVISGANGGYCVRCSIEGALENKYHVWADNRAIIDFNPRSFTYPYYYEGTLRVEKDIEKEFFNQSDKPGYINELLEDENKPAAAALQSCAEVFK